MANENELKKYFDENGQAKESINDYLRDKGKSHKYYKIYYKSYKIVKEILDKKSLLFRNSDFNDAEEKLNKVNGKYPFILCLTFSQKENIGMWSMYGCKEGMMIEYSQSFINKYLLGPKVEIELGDFKKGTFSKVTSCNDYEINCYDVLYKEVSDKNIVKIKRHDEVVKNLNENSLKNVYDFLIKRYEWNYENECRIIIWVDEKYIKDAKEINCVRFPIADDELKELKIVLSPTTDIEYNQLKDTNLINNIEFKESNLHDNVKFFSWKECNYNCDNCFYKTDKKTEKP